MFADAFLFERCLAVQLVCKILQEGSYNESSDKILFKGRKNIMD